MTESVFGTAQWIARAVPASTRVLRNIASDRVDWASPDRTLGQVFEASGPVVAVSISLTEPRGVDDPYTSDVDFTVALRRHDGREFASRRWTGPQLVWDSFGVLLEVDPPAPPGTYRIEVRSNRGEIGWLSGVGGSASPDDGISPVAVTSGALIDGHPVPGVRTIGVDTIPAPNPMFRRGFVLDTLPETAMLSASVLGTGVVMINGRRVGVEALEPAVTDYDRTVLFRTWDVGHLLVLGENEIEVHAGRERYAARGGDVWGWNLAPWHREPVALLRLAMEDPAGTSQAIETGPEWQAAPGSVAVERLFRGEDWVVRRNPPAWEPAVVVSAPRGELRRAEFEPVTPGPTLAPRVSTAIDDHRTVHDFGDVMVGRLQCRVTGSAGAAIRVRSGEQRAHDGSVVCDNSLVAGEAQLDTLVLETDVDDEPWEIRFGYRGFRWIQVEIRGDARIHGVRAVPLYTELPVVGELSTDEPVLAWINDATARTFRNNLHGIPTDTPIYEKNGWTADAHLATEGLLHHFDLRAAFTKWLEDHRDAQAFDGSIPQIIPTPGWGRESDPAWSSSAVFIPWYLYREYGDAGVLEQALPMVVGFADSLIDRLERGLWTRRTWGDWLAPGYHLGPEGMRPVGTIMAAAALQRTAAVLRELEDPRAQHYGDVADQVALRYDQEYFDPATESYRVPGVGYRQVLNILPVAFDLIPPHRRAPVQRSLIGDLEKRTFGHLDCGAIGVRHLLPVLSEAGRDDLALTVLTQRTRPSWGAWYEAGESTLMESWEADARSRNHYFLGSAASWIQQRVGGLRLTEPGWRRFEVLPIDDPRVTRASMRHRTPRGDVAIRWERGPSGWRVELLVPEETTADVRIAGGEQSLQSGRHLLRIR